MKLNLYEENENLLNKIIISIIMLSKPKGFSN